MEMGRGMEAPRNQIKSLGIETYSSWILPPGLIHSTFDHCILNNEFQRTLWAPRFIKHFLQKMSILKKIGKLPFSFLLELQCPKRAPRRLSDQALCLCPAFCYWCLFDNILYYMINNNTKLHILLCFKWSFANVINSVWWIGTVPLKWNKTFLFTFSL